MLRRATGRQDGPLGSPRFPKPVVPSLCIRPNRPNGSDAAFFLPRDRTARGANLSGPFPAAGRGVLEERPQKRSLLRDAQTRPFFLFLLFPRSSPGLSPHRPENDGGGHFSGSDDVRPPTPDCLKRPVCQGVGLLFRGPVRGRIRGPVRGPANGHETYVDRILSMDLRWKARRGAGPGPALGPGPGCAPRDRRRRAARSTIPQRPGGLRPAGGGRARLTRAEESVPAVRAAPRGASGIVSSGFRVNGLMTLTGSAGRHTMQFSASGPAFFLPGCEKAVVLQVGGVLSKRCRAVVQAPRAQPIPPRTGPCAFPPSSFLARAFLPPSPAVLRGRRGPLFLKTTVADSALSALHASSALRDSIVYPSPRACGALRGLSMCRSKKSMIRLRRSMRCTGSPRRESEWPASG